MRDFDAHTFQDIMSKLHLLATIIDEDPSRLTRRIQRIVRDQAAAEDLSQDALLHAIRGLPNFRGNAELSQLYPWLDQIARNLAYNYVRDRGRHPRQESLEEQCYNGEMLERLAVNMTDPAFISSQAENHAYLVSLIQNLPPDVRKVFLFRGVEGLSTATTATMLGISEDLVKWRLQRARKLLRQQLLVQVE